MLQTTQSLGSLAGKRVLVRATLDVAAHDRRVDPADTWRVDAWLGDIKQLAASGARVVLMGHRGRPSGRRVEDLSLRPVYEHIQKQLSVPVFFSEEAVGEKVTQKVESLQNGEVLVLENLRFNPGERENARDFAEQLAHLGEVYINNDFASTHRAHASVVGVPDFLPAAAGPLVEREVEALSQLKDARGDELAVIIGGAKVATKIKVVQAFLQKENKVLLAGVLANMFLRGEGYEVGQSVMGDMSLVPTELAEDERVFLPKDVVVSHSLKQAEEMRTVPVEEVGEDDAIVDIGPQTLQRFTREIKTAKKVLWNGPLGLVEVPAFREGSAAFARAFTAVEGETFVGGGDVVTFLQEEELDVQVDVISTAGGAMLAFLANEELPGLTVLEG